MFTLPSFVRSYLRKMVVASSRDRMTPRLASVLRKLSTVMLFPGRPKSRKPVFSSVDPGATRSFSFSGARLDGLDADGHGHGRSAAEAFAIPDPCSREHTHTHTHTRRHARPLSSLFVFCKTNKLKIDQITAVHKSTITLLH